MQRDQSDQEINFKKRARRRLVGAIALVILMIILLPMVLKDRAANNPQEKITINIQNQKPLNEAKLEQKPSDFDSSIVPEQPLSQANSQVTPQNSSEAVVIEPDPEANVKEDSKAEVKLEPKPALDRGETKLTNSEKPIIEKSDQIQKFYVQIGVFTDPENVKRLQAKLNELGYKSQTESVVSPKGNKIRLKTNTFADRNDASLALEKIKSAGLTGMVVAK
jgi:DedD protein